MFCIAAVVLYVSLLGTGTLTKALGSIAMAGLLAE